MALAQGVAARHMTRAKMSTSSVRLAKPLGLLSSIASVAVLAGACATGVSDEGADLLSDAGAAPAADARAADAKGDVGHPTAANDAAADTSSTTPPGDDALDANLPGDASPDADPSASNDAGSDAGADASDGVDAGHDAGVDAGPGVDAGQDAGCTTGSVLLNEVQVAGTGGAEDEWVEIRNGGSCPLSLSGWTLKHTSTTGTSVQTVWTGGASASIPGHGYGILAGQTYSAAATPVGSFGSGVLAATGGGLGLYDASGALRDAMGYGAGASNPFVRGGPAAVSPAAQSMARTPDGANAANDDSVDFAVATKPTPGASN